MTNPLKEVFDAEKQLMDAAAAYAAALGRLDGADLESLSRQSVATARNIQRAFGVVSEQLADQEPPARAHIRLIPEEPA